VNRRGVVIVLAVAISLVGVAGGASAWAAAYDQRNAGRLLPGTTIQGVPVGGMTVANATDVLRRRLEDPLRRPVRLHSGEVEIMTTPWDLGLQVDVKAAVRKAQGDADGNLVMRVWRRLFSRPQRVVAAEPKWDRPTLDGVLVDVAEKVHVDPKDVALDASTGWLEIVGPKPGVDVDIDRSRQAILDAVTLGDAEVKLATRAVSAASDGQAHLAILVRTGENKLYLYRNGVIVKDWSVATGAPGYATPVGQWKITQEIANPSWHNPGSAWARGLPAVIPPGPNNPLGTHALRLDAPAILIHGTPDRSSIGFNASHGCIRMLQEQELELAELVDVGTPVVVVDAGTPQARPTTPTTTSAEQSAAVQF